eukprot:scaffold32973_cov31-Tisochrysis_lutea.AAC.4
MGTELTGTTGPICGLLPYNLILSLAEASFPVIVWEDCPIVRCGGSFIGEISETESTALLAPQSGVPTLSQLPPG